MPRRISTGFVSSGSSGPSKRAPTDGDEVAVIPPPSRIALTAPDYFTIELPYAICNIESTARSASGENIRVFRLNSIFDPDFLSTAQKRPMGRDTWSQVFDFYRVLKCSMEVVIHNNDDENLTSTDRDTVIVGLEWGESTTEFSATENAFMEGKQSIAKFLPGRYETGNTTVLNYTYTPESWDYHVMETSTEERWTPIGQDPTDSHLIAVRAFPLISTDVHPYSLEYMIRLVYTVQFREVKNNILNEEDTGVPDP